MKTAAQPPGKARSDGRSVAAENAAILLALITENATVLMNRWTGEWTSFVNNLSAVGGLRHPTKIDLSSLAKALSQEGAPG